MKIVQGDQVKGDGHGGHRGGTAEFTRIIEGDDNSPIDNFSFAHVRTPGRFSPRHRHNFEQFRFQLGGIADYGRTGKLKPGMFGYFPEGVHYGPQTQEEGEELTLLVLQCGGASGNGYPGRTKTKIASAELKQYGTFKDGVFFRNEGLPGKPTMDSFQAIWEHLNQKPLVYPKPRYDVPILMHPDSVEWTEIPGAKCVFERFMGEFTECQTSARFVCLDPGASCRLEGNRDLYAVLSGTGTVESEPMRFLTTIFLEKGDKAELKAKDRVELLHMHLPELAHVKARAKHSPVAQAAE